MNYRPSAPKDSGLVCSGDRLVIPTSQLRESPQMVEEELQRAEPRPAAGEAQEGVHRPWWRRLFGV
jgi:hypothetical protein